MKFEDITKKDIKRRIISKFPPDGQIRIGTIVKVLNIGGGPNDKIVYILWDKKHTPTPYFSYDSVYFKYMKMESNLANSNPNKTFTQRNL